MRLFLPLLLGSGQCVAAQLTIPPTWRPAVIDACEAAGGFSRLVGPAGADPFESCTFTTTEAAKHSGRSLQWTFKPRAGAAAVGLSHAASALTGPGAVSLWLKNPAGSPLRLAVQFVENDGSVYASDPVDLGGQTGWRQLVFLTDALRPLPGSKGALDFPPTRLSIVLEGADPKAATTLYLDEIVAYLAPRDKLNVGAISAPGAATPGDEIEARAVLQAPEPLRRPHRVTLALIGGEVVVAEADLRFAQDPSAWRPGEMVESVPTRVRLPKFVAGGKYALKVRGDDLDLGGRAADGVPIEVGGPMVGSLTVAVDEQNGAPTALANNAPFSLFAWFCGGGDLDRLGRLPANPLPVIVLPVTADHDPYGQAAEVWLARDRWAYSALDRSVMSALNAQPRARLLLRVFLCAPDWWATGNPQEQMLFAPGRHAVEVPGVPGSHTYPSFSSEKWRTAAGECLRRFVAHVEGAPYADHVIGYLLAAGEDGRWRYWGSAEGLYGDYSRPQRAAFVAWLRERYHNDIRKLRGAWQDIVNPLPPMGGPGKAIPALGWEDVDVPPRSARTDHPTQALHDPAAAPEVIDYNLFHAHAVADTIARFAAVAKQACQKRKLVGVSYGHLFDHARDGDELQTAGHIALGAVLADENLDFLAAPSSVSERAQAPLVWTSLAQSVRSHRKLWIDEALPADVVRGPFSWREAAVSLTGAGSALCANTGEAFPRALALAQASVNWERASMSEIAVIVDDYSLAYLAQGHALSRPLLVRQQLELAQIGAPVDVWLLDDLIAGRVPDYKLYVVVDAFLLDAKARETVRNHIARSGKTALWIFAPGALDDMASGHTSLELTGLSIAFVQKTGNLRVKIIDNAHPLLDGVPRGLEYGAAEPTGPIFFALPTKGCDPLGAIEVPSIGGNKPVAWAGLISREFDAWTSIFSAAPDVPAVVLRSLARHAGVHLYLETGDVVGANASLLAIQALTDGEKHIRLPAAADVRDAVSGERVATGASEFTVSMRAGETRLFYTGEEKRFGL